MKAKLLKSLRLGGALIAPRADKVTLVELDDAEYERLLDLGKILRPTEDELKIGVVANPKPASAAEPEVATKAAADKAAADKGGKKSGSPDSEL